MSKLFVVILGCIVLFRKYEYIVCEYVTVAFNNLATITIRHQRSPIHISIFPRGFTSGGRREKGNIFPLSGDMCIQDVW
jgi:hypothetical protein